MAYLEEAYQHLASLRVPQWEQSMQHVLSQEIMTSFTQTSHTFLRMYQFSYKSHVNYVSCLTKKHAKESWKRTYLLAGANRAELIFVWLSNDKKNIWKCLMQSKRNSCSVAHPVCSIDCYQLCWAVHSGQLSTHHQRCDMHLDEQTTRTQDMTSIKFRGI